MATVVHFVNDPFVSQSESTNHRFRAAASKWRNLTEMDYQGCSVQLGPSEIGNRLLIRDFRAQNQTFHRNWVHLADGRSNGLKVDASS